VVRCDLRQGVADLAGKLVERGLFTPAAGVKPVGSPPASYLAYRTESGDGKHLDGKLSARLAQLENDVSRQARESTMDDDDLLVADGPLHERRSLPRAIGYIKTHSRSYLPRELSTVVTGLPAGQRTPVFQLSSLYSWYLRLPASRAPIGGGPGQPASAPVGSPWAGIVRVECSADLPVQQAIELADLSAMALPRFAASAYKDPRAPQNLIPIAGLERRLKALLGDPRLLLRSLRRATVA
jgi:hypothetical protein